MRCGTWGITMKADDEDRETEKRAACASESVEKYRALIALAADGMLLASHDEIITEANDQMCVMTGVAREDLLGRHFGEFPFTPESLRGVPLRFDRVRQGEIVISERAIRRSDGSDMVVEMRTRMMPDGTFQSIFRDITDRKRAEDLLRESEERYRLFVQETHEGINLIDEEGRVVIWNRMLERITGIPASETLGRYQWDVMYAMLPPERRSPQWHARFKAAVESSLKTGEPPAGGAREITRVRDDGTTACFEQSVFPIKTAKGYQFASINRDVTETKKLMEHAIQHQKLESLGVLAGGIAHDFNNLLGGIFGYLDLARLSSNPSDVPKYLSQAMNAIDRARNLTRQLLTFAKGGAPARRIESLTPFLEETTEFSLSGSAISCRFDMEDGLWPCNFDRNQIAQVIDNLVRNAQEAMPMGGTIAVSARNVGRGAKEHPALGEGRHVAIVIADKGIGIPGEILPRIFDPFFTTKRKGHGLGLATCYSIVAQHGGSIAVTSEPGKGSTFTICLPAAEGNVHAASLRSPLSHARSGRVLVMDDEDMVREIMCDMLATLGYDVGRACHGAEAVALFEEAAAGGSPFTAVILDLTVPGGMGGEQAAMAIRRLDAAVPIFMASGYADAPVMADPKKRGFTASLPKPFTFEELAGLLDLHLPGAK
jgi:two-component system, cell cycle sensor histidine kinase and response regulator CckA